MTSPNNNSVTSTFAAAFPCPRLDVNITEHGPECTIPGGYLLGNETNSTRTLQAPQEQFVPPDQFLTQNPHPSQQDLDRWIQICEDTGHTSDYCISNSPIPHEQLCRDLLPQFLAANGCPLQSSTHGAPMGSTLSLGSRSGSGHHTAAYWDGYRQGRIDRQNGNPIDAPATCDSFSFGNNKDWNHCVSGYNDAVNGR